MDIDSIIEIARGFGLKLVVAIAILFFGKLIIKYVKKLVNRIFKRRGVESSISGFLTSLINTTLWVILIISALTHLGIQTTSFIALLGAAGLAIGLALQGSLANFAAGFLIILFRPFKINDLINVGGNLGIITGINMFNTEMKTLDNTKIIIPNSQIMNNTITNITAEPIRRVDLMFSVAPNNNVQKIKDIIKGLLDAHELIITDPPTLVRMSNMTHSSLDFTVRAWCNTADYWLVYFDITEQVREEFIRNNVDLSIPKSEVKVLKE